jgi:hypothetical protein
MMAFAVRPGNSSGNVSAADSELGEFAAARGGQFAA